MNNKKTIKLTESQLRSLVRKIVTEGVYGFPDTIDHIILRFENDRECMAYYEAIVKSLVKKYHKGIELDVNELANSSQMKKFQMLCFRKFTEEQPDVDRTTSPALFRRYVSEKMIESILDGQWDNLVEENVEKPQSEDETTLHEIIKESLNKVLMQHMSR